MVGIHIDDSVFGKQVHKMEQIIDKKAAELERAEYEKYIPIFETATRFLKKRPVLMYGGLAIHDIMPKKLKLYGPYTLPDIDVFAYKPKEVAKDLVKYMKKHGFPLTTIGEALHEGTLKVYSQGQQIVDMTYIPKAAFRRLSKNAMMGSLGIRIVDPQYLRMSLHQMLAQPNLDRWPKVLKRIVNFYTAFPPTKCKLTAEAQVPPQIPEELVDAIYETPVLANAVFMGCREIEAITENKVKSYQIDGVPPIIAIVEDPLKMAKEIIKACSDWELHVSELYDTETHLPLPAHVFLTYKKKKVVLLFEAISCFTYVTYRNRRVASLHSIIYLYLSILGSNFKHFDVMLDSLECIANTLSYVQLESFHSNRKLTQQFALECFGPQYSIATLRRARLERRKK